MRLGTPLSPNATKVMMLGSGELGKEVVISLQRLGVEVIAVDRYENAPAQQVAHSSHTIDMTDAKALRALVETVKPTMIVPEIEAIATDELARIESDGLCEIIPTALATQVTMNREAIRCLAAEDLGLATSKFGFADSVDELAAIIETTTGLPAIVKPVMSSSGKGQSMIKTKDDIQKAWDYAQSDGRVAGGRIIVEEKIEFDYEITLLTVRALSPSGTIETHFCDPVGHVQQDGDYVESWQPQPMSPKALAAAKHMAKTVTDKLGGRGLFGVELFIKGDHVWFSEVSPRPHDTGMVTMATQAQNEFELHARAILGLPVDAKARSAGASAVIYGGVDEESIGFENVEAAMAIEGVDVRLFGKPESFKRRRMGVAIAYGETIEIARERAKKAASLVKPIGSGA